MQYTWESLFDFDYQQGLIAVFLLTFAYVLALPIGIERSRKHSRAGLRTFPIVSMVSCGFMLTGYLTYQDDEAFSKVLYGVITGIGFIGGGAILKIKTDILGTATAASIWAAGAIGIAAASGQLIVAVALSLVTTLTLSFFSRPHGDSDHFSSSE